MGNATSYQYNWWALFSLACSKKTLPDTSDCLPLSQFPFEVCGGLTTGEFYTINVKNSPKGSNLKLLTSGSIEPNESLWGSQTTRFGGSRYLHPRVVGSSISSLQEGNDYPRSLQNKLRRSHRPKIIIASLTKNIEALVDERGEYQPSTATQVIFHREDDVEQLKKLCGLLLKHRAHFLFKHILGYNAMHSSISMEKSFLEHFPIPSGSLSSSS